MDDPHAAEPTVPRFPYEFPQHHLCFKGGEPVEIRFGFDTETSSAKLLKGAMGKARVPIGGLVAELFEGIPFGG